mmetsp:Transcript_16208/g.44874  ORF Transcript_16208/g.44874 Transcript_16208/m.44874 type:complete len:374 (+) Transcript_16208:236-1357(+)
MKLCSLLSISQLLALVCSTSAMSKVSGNGRGLRKILSKARRLEDNGEDNGDDGNNDGEQNAADMEAFLMDYSMKFMECIPDQVLTDADYNDHFGVVIFRLCPANKCSKNDGCSSGYADFAVDVGTYVDAFLEDQADNMNWDDKFDVDEFGQCSEYEADTDDDGKEYYIGPGCTADGKGVKMGVYEDKYCYQESQTSFETLSNGWGLPYSNGGLVSTQCTSCTDDDGALREMCLDLYDTSPFRCETEFDFKHYYYDTNFEMYRYGQDTTGCTKIDVMRNPRRKFSQEAVWTDVILVIMLVVVTFAGYAWYSSWWEEQKLNLEKIDDDEDSQAYQLDDADDNSDYSGDGGEVNESGVSDSAISNYEAPVAEGTLT